jgi:hypothetical protein
MREIISIYFDFFLGERVCNISKDNQCIDSVFLKKDKLILRLFRNDILLQLETTINHHTIPLLLSLTTIQSKIFISAVLIITTGRNVFFVIVGVE